METNEIKENEIRREILDDVTPVEPEKIKFEESQNEQTTETAPDEQPEQVTANVNLMDFGNIITGVYCNVSDAVYKKIKKSETAPAWTPEMRQGINDALTAYLSTVNIAVKPIYALVATLATCEIMRYSGLNA